MNKKRVGILVSTLLVLIMAFSLLAGCGLESFKKKVKNKVGSMKNTVVRQQWQRHLY